MSDLLAARLSEWALTYLIHSTLLFALAWLITHRVAESPAVREVIWKTAMIGALVTSSLQSSIAFEPMGGVFSVAHAAPAPSRVATPQPEPAPTKGLKPAKSAAPAEVPGLAPGELQPAGPEPASSTRGMAWPSSTALVLGWLAIAGVLVGGFLVVRTRAIRRIGTRHPVTDPRLSGLLAELRTLAGVSRPIQLTCAPALPSPVALGHDEICVPNAALTELDADQQRTMLAHELAHLTRRDPLWLTVGCLIERLFFFQPFNRLARRRIQEAAEFLCDDWAVRHTGSGLNLAKCLVKVAEWVDTRPYPVPVSAMAERRSQLVSRIHRLIENRAMSAQPSRQLMLAGAFGLILLTAAVAPGVTAHQTPSTGPADSLVEDSRQTVPDAAAVLAADTQRAAAPAAPSDTDEIRTRLAPARIRTMTLRAMQQAERAMSRIRWSHATTPLAATAPSVPAMPAIAPRAAFSLFGHSRKQHDTTSVAVPALIQALKDPDLEVRRAAARALARYEDPRSVPAFIEALKDADAEVRATSADALGNLGDSRAVGPLSALLKDANADVRHQALSALDNLDVPVPTATLVEAMGDKDADVRQAAISLASEQMSDEHKDPALFSPLAGLLKDPSADVRQQAANALGELGDARAADPLTATLRDQNGDVRQAAAEALGELHLTTAPPALVDAAKDPNPDVRHQVAHTLGEIGDAKAVPILKNLLGDSNDDVRQAAVESLSEIRDSAALDALIQALKSTDPVVRRAAAEALGQREN
jgi:HEAT repeat protein/beta-lactamase regulating signal transducer with metallopeptidase domain